MAPEPRLEGGKRWVLEKAANVTDEQITISPEAASQSVLLSQCSNAVIQVAGTCAALSVDGCTSVGVLLSDVKSSVEVVNCSRVKLQCTENVSTIDINKTDSCQLILPSSIARSVQVTTSLSQEVNVVELLDSEDGDSCETPIPDQFVTQWSETSRRFVTRPVEHAGSG